MIEKLNDVYGIRAATTPAPARRWRVRRSYYPLALPGEALGEVEATTRAKAEELAVATYGGPIALEPVTLRELLEPLERAVERGERSAARHNVHARAVRDLFIESPGRAPTSKET